jgi:hypothetical protein
MRGSRDAHINTILLYRFMIHVTVTILRAGTLHVVMYRPGVLHVYSATALLVYTMCTKLHWV